MTNLSPTSDPLPFSSFHFFITHNATVTQVAFSNEGAVTPEKNEPDTKSFRSDGSRCDRAFPAVDAAPFYRALSVKN